MGKDMVSIKGTRNGLLIVLEPNREFDEIRNTLLSKMELAKGFFRGAKFSFLQGQQDMPPHQKNELETICRQFGLVPNSERHAQIRAEFAQVPIKRAVAATQSSQGEEALMVRRSLRSGQRVSYHGHIVVLGDIHPGAEVISGGNILVIGSCRGIVHAGAGGERSAKIIAHQLAPTVLSIADRRYAPGKDFKIPPGRMTARLSGQEIVFEHFHS